MKDIPVFTTENGVGSLIFKEIPYTGAAYIRIADTMAPEAFLEDCVGFCRAVGAVKIYATGHSCLDTRPFHTAVLRMQIGRQQLPDTDAALFPVTEQTLEQWRTLYNDRMQAVPNVSYMTGADADAMLRRGDGYFIHREDVLLGLGIAAGSRLDAVASLVPGSGGECVCALNHALSGETMDLDVASTNRPAMALYEKLGFLPVEERSRWYKIL